MFRILRNLRPRFVRPYATYKTFQGNQKPQISVRSILQDRRVQYFGAGCVGFYFYNLDAAPFTGRLRCIWIPYWLERKIGDYSYRQILAQYGRQLAPATDPSVRQIREVMNRLLALAIDNTQDPKQASHLKLLDWAIHVIQVPPTEPPNAFILPNGKIFIFLSILPLCRNQDGLATVLSHELSHQLAHHSLEQLSKQPLYIALSSFLYATTGISWFNELLIAGLFQMPASREMESEADRIGCELMARLCFRVEEGVHFWQRMANWELHSQPKVGVLGEFLSTHPNTEKRTRDISSWLPELESIRESSNCYQWGQFNDFSRNFFKR